MGQDRLTTIDHGVRGAASEAVLEPPGGTENNPLLGADLQVGHLTRQRCRLSVSHREGVRTTAVRRCADWADLDAVLYADQAGESLALPTRPTKATTTKTSADASPRDPSI